MRSKGFKGMMCSAAGVLDALGDRWAMLIVRDLSLALCRYEDLRKSTGVTNATLSDRLKFVDRRNGHTVKLALVDEKTGEVVRRRDITPRAGPGADELVHWRLRKFDSRNP